MTHFEMAGLFSAEKKKTDAPDDAQLTEREKNKKHSAEFNKGI